mgnify:FL=1|tara:strand:- start:897 stop:1508 length:612 start_codon:yes stop_codon:yes gene_type:complete
MIVKNIMKLLLVSSFILGSLFSQMPSKDFDGWNLLQDNDIIIEYIQNDFPWCKASIKLPYSVDEILVVVENVNDYKEILHSVLYSKKDENDIAHIRINYPFPFTDREYIVKFKKIFDDNDVVYAFSTNDKLNENINPDYIRLINAQGEWRLSPLNENLTEVSYIWNGELRGEFPSWGLSKAWVRHGNEVLGSLRHKLEDINGK